MDGLSEQNRRRSSRPGRPPDFAFGIYRRTYVDQWAYEDRLVDLTDAIGLFADLFDPDPLERATLLNGRTGRARRFTRCRWGATTNHVHVWKSLLEQAGFTLADVPKSGRRSGRSGAIRFSPRCAT